MKKFTYISARIHQQDMHTGVMLTIFQAQYQLQMNHNISKSDATLIIQFPASLRFKIYFYYYLSTNNVKFSLDDQMRVATTQYPSFVI